MALINEAECLVAAQRIEGWTQKPDAVARSTGLSTTYVAALQRSLINRGLTDAWIAMAGHVAHDALLVEAMVWNWRTALSQANRYRAWLPKAAIAVPRSVAAQVDRDYIHRVGLGLISVTPEGAEWVRRPSLDQPPLAARLWLAELLRKEAQSPSRPRNS
jgi:hypothetical protein